MVQNSKRIIREVQTREPLLTRQSLATLLQAVAIFYPPIHDLIIEWGGQEGLFTTILFIQGIASYFQRRRVTPNAS